MSKIRTCAVAAALMLLPMHGNAQYFGHEYEGTQAPIREGEQPTIPLDTGDPSFNAWRTPLPSFEGNKEGRTPGLVDPQRFFGQGYMQIRPFCTSRWHSHPPTLLRARWMSRSWARSPTWEAARAALRADPTQCVIRRSISAMERGNRTCMSWSIRYRT